MFPYFRRTGGSMLLSILIILACCSFLGPVSASHAAILPELLTLDVAPNPATTEDPLVATITGVASCPQIVETNIGIGVVEIGFSGHCPILPPTPGDFTLHTLIDPLPPGIWEIRLLDLDLPVVPPAVVDIVTVTVTDPRFSIELEPSPATEDDEVTAQIVVEASCPVPLAPEIEPGSIRIPVFDGGICDPPQPIGRVEFDLPLGQLAGGAYLVELMFDDQRVAESDLLVLPAGLCVPDPTSLCLNDGRFRVEAAWTTVEGLTGSAMAVDETGDTGFFWFFDPANIELVVKVLDACDTAFDSFWVFAGGLTDVEVVLTVTDTKNGTSVTYLNPVGQRFTTITDTAAFATCP